MTLTKCINTFWPNTCVYVLMGVRARSAATVLSSPVWHEIRIPFPEGTKYSFPVNYPDYVVLKFYSLGSKPGGSLK